MTSSNEDEQTGTKPTANDLAAILSGAQTPASSRGINQEELEAQYAYAFELQQQGNHEEALEAVSLLLNLDAWQPKFHYLCGLCLQHLSQPAAAAKTYAQALLLDATDALTAYRMAECLAATGDQEAAKEALAAAINLSYAGDDQSHIKEVAETLLQHLEAI